MFDAFSEAAEKLATNVSRRAFLGRLGQGALGVAGVIGGMLAFGGAARANGPCPGKMLACYGYSTFVCCRPGQNCCVRFGIPLCC